MKSQLLNIALVCLTSAAGQVSPTRDLLLPLMHGCGNIEFDVNFMRPSIIISEAKLIKNLTVTDARDLNNPMRVQLNGHSKQDIITID